MRLAHGLILVWLAGGAACAQPLPIGAQETEHARQLLHSTSWVDKAWGAYLAGRLHAEDLREPLLEEFRQAGALSGAKFGEEHAFVAALFDAAIAADITVPAALLEPFEEDWSGQVLILLARDKDSEDSLLRLGEEKARDLEWLTANNLLAEMKSPRWYGNTLGAVSVTHRFTVTDPNDGAGIGGGLGGGVCGDGFARMPKGFPPVTLYTLQDSPGKGSVLLAQGPRDVYYKRTVVPTDRQVGFGSCRSTFNRMTIRIGYLAKLVNMPADQAENLFHRETAIRYSGIEQFRREVESRLEMQERGIRGLIQTAKERGLDCGPGVRLRIVPEVNDRRQNAADVLPVVAPRDILFP